MDEMDTAENLEKRLAQADVVASMPAGNEGKPSICFPERQFAAMKEGAVFLNVGQGNIIGYRRCQKC